MNIMKMVLIGVVVVLIFLGIIFVLGQPFCMNAGFERSEAITVCNKWCSEGNMEKFCNLSVSIDPNPSRWWDCDRFESFSCEELTTCNISCD